MAKEVAGGGVFSQARAPEALSAWYAAHLGIEAQDGGALVFSGAESAGMTVFAHFSEDTPYFGHGQQKVMVNFRVDDLDLLLEQLDEAGVEIEPKLENFDYGRFAWIRDIEGNRVELWEPLRAE